METCNLNGAAKILQCCPGTVRDLIRQDKIPAVKIGRSYVILMQDIVEFIRQAQNEKRLSVHGKERQPCHYTNGRKSGGYTSHDQTVQELDALLGLPTDRKHSSTTIN